MRYFISKHGATIQTPDNIILKDFPPIEECSWSWYLSQVKRNMTLGNPEHDNEENTQRFWHAKYYGKAYMAIDRITSEFGVGRHRGTSLGIES